MQNSQNQDEPQHPKSGIFAEYMRKIQASFMDQGFDPDDAASIARQAAKLRQDRKRRGLNPWAAPFIGIRFAPDGQPVVHLMGEGIV